MRLDSKLGSNNNMLSTFVRGFFSILSISFLQQIFSRDFNQRADLIMYNSLKDKYGIYVEVGSHDRKTASKEMS